MSFYCSKISEAEASRRFISSEITSEINQSKNVGGFESEPIISMEDGDNAENFEECIDYFKSLTSLRTYLPSLAVFLNYLLSNSNPNNLFFYLITDLYEEGTIKDLRRWVFEIYSCFLIPKAPLQISNLDCCNTKEIEQTLCQDGSEEVLRTIFCKTRLQLEEELNKELEEFQHKRNVGLGTIFGPNDQILLKITEKTKEIKLYEELFKDKIKLYSEKRLNYKSEKFYLAAALSTVLIRIFGLSPSTFNINIQKTFVRKEKWSKSKMFGLYSKKLQVHGHEMIRRQYSHVIICNYCNGIIYGIAPQGYECSVCLINLHKSCVNLYEERCPGVFLIQKNCDGGNQGVLNAGHIDNHNCEEEVSRISDSSQSFACKGPDSVLIGTNNNLDSDWTSEEENESTTEFLEELQPHEKKRLDIIEEFFGTEYSHVRNLRVLYEIFYKPLSHSQILTTEELDLVFPNIEQVLDLHSHLKDEMKKIRKKNSLCQNLGRLLVEWFGGFPGKQLQKTAALFCERQHLALELIMDKRKKDQKFEGILMDCEKHKQCRRLPLQGILPTEMQRLSKYPLLMQRLIETMESDELFDESIREEVMNLQEALRLSKELIKYVDEATKRAADRSRLEEIQRLLDVSYFDRFEHPMSQEFKSLDLTQHKLILEGSMQLRRPNKGNVPVQILLLEEVVIILQKDNEKFLLRCFQSGICSHPLLPPIIEISNLLVRNNATYKNALFLVSTSSNDCQIFDLLVDEDNKRDTWYNHISEAINCKRERETLGETVNAQMKICSQDSLTEHNIDEHLRQMNNS